MVETLKNGITSWIKAMNMRGTFGRRNQNDKVVVEVSTVEEWAKAVASKFGLQVTEICSCNDDPPDCIANIENKRISIELAELVDSNRVKESVKAVEAGYEPPHYHGKSFEKAQWSKGRFFKELNSLIDKKEMKYQQNKFVFDVLIIHTDEPWLTPEQAKSWLGEREIEQRSSFKTAFLLMTDTPGYADHWPVFCLFGKRN